MLFVVCALTIDDSGTYSSKKSERHCYCCSFLKSRLDPIILKYVKILSVRAFLTVCTSPVDRRAVLKYLPSTSPHHVSTSHASHTTSTKQSARNTLKQSKTTHSTELVLPLSPVMLMATPIALTTMMDADDAATLQQNNSSSKLETVPTSSVDTATTNLADTTNPNGTSTLRPEIQILKDEHSALLRENEMLKEIWGRIIQQSEKATTSTTTTSKCNNYNNVVSSDNNNNNKGDDANIEDEMKNLHLEQQQQQQQQQYSSETPQMTPLSSDYDEDTSNEQGVPNTIDISDRSRESCFADEPSDFDRSNTNITDHQSDNQQQNQQQQQLEKRKFNYRRRSDEEEPIDYFEIYS
jgi:hypothetical protein